MFRTMTKPKRFTFGTLAALIVAATVAHFIGGAIGTAAGTADALHDTMNKAAIGVNKVILQAGSQIGPHVKANPVTVEADSSITYHLVYDAGYGPDSTALTNSYCKTPSYEFFRNKGVAINWNSETDMGVVISRLKTQPSDCR